MDSKNSEQLDSSIKEVLKNASLPYSSESWTEMDQLLDKDTGKYGNSLSDYSQYMVVGALGLLLIGGLLFMIFRNGSSEQDMVEVESPSLDTTKLTANIIVQDSVKKDTTSVLVNAADTVNKNTTAEAIAQEGEGKKKRTRDSLSVSSTSPEASTDTTGTKKKKKKKKKGSNKDSLKAANPSEGINFIENIDKPLPAEEPVKSSKDSSK